MKISKLITCLKRNRSKSINTNNANKSEPKIFGPENRPADWKTPEREKPENKKIDISWQRVHDRCWKGVAACSDEQNTTGSPTPTAPWCERLIIAKLNGELLPIFRHRKENDSTEHWLRYMRRTSVEKLLTHQSRQEERQERHRILCFTDFLEPTYNAGRPIKFKAEINKKPFDITDITSIGLYRAAATGHDNKAIQPQPVLTTRNFYKSARDDLLIIKFDESPQTEKPEMFFVGVVGRHGFIAQSVGFHIVPKEVTGKTKETNKEKPIRENSKMKRWKSVHDLPKVATSVEESIELDQTKRNLRDMSRALWKARWSNARLVNEKQTLLKKAESATMEEIWLVLLMLLLSFFSVEMALITAIMVTSIAYVNTSTPAARQTNYKQQLEDEQERAEFYRIRYQETLQQLRRKREEH